MPHRTSSGPEEASSWRHLGEQRHERKLLECACKEQRVSVLLCKVLADEENTESTLRKALAQEFDQCSKSCGRKRKGKGHLFSSRNIPEKEVNIWTLFK